jgi:ABC-type polysaccharide/polyol phosphate export permease
MATILAGVPATALEDVSQAALSWRLWHALAWTDVKRQFHPSRLGALWLPILTSVHIAVLTFIFSHINQVEAGSFALYVGTGFITWQYMSDILLEGAGLFRQAEPAIRNSIQPRSLFVFRLVQRHAIRLALNALVIVGSCVLFWHAPGLEALFLLASVLILLAAGPGIGLLVALIGLRYPDVRLMITLLVRISLFATPIFWLPERLGAYAGFVQFNPFYHFIQLVRQPLLGHLPAASDVGVALAITALAWLAAMALYRAWLPKLIFWL